MGHWEEGGIRVKSYICSKGQSKTMLASYFLGGHSPCLSSGSAISVLIRDAYAGGQLPILPFPRT